MGHGSRSRTVDLRHPMEMQPDMTTEGEKGSQPALCFGRGARGEGNATPGGWEGAGE